GFGGSCSVKRDSAASTSNFKPAEACASALAVSHAVDKMAVGGQRFAPRAAWRVMALLISKASIEPSSPDADGWRRARGGEGVWGSKRECDPEWVCVCVWIRAARPRC